MHRESPATRAVLRQAQPSQREGQLDDDVDYQTAYQSARTVAVNGVIGCSIAASGPVQYTDRLSMASNKVGKDRSMTTQAQRHHAIAQSVLDNQRRQPPLTDG